VSVSRQGVASGAPRLRDQWAGRRFTPRLIAPTVFGIWLVESLLPLLVRVDPTTGAISRPLPVTTPEGASGEAHALAPREGAVWLQFSEGLTRFDTATGEQQSLATVTIGLAAGEEGIWALAGSGKVARVHDDGAGLDLLGEPEERRSRVAVGHGAVFTLAWTRVSSASDLSTLSRLDVPTGAVERRIALDGTPQGLMSDRGAIWVHLCRRRSGSQGEAVLVGLDPETLDPRSEIAITPVGSIGPVLDGVVYLPSADPYDPVERGQASEVRRIDAATGELLSETTVPGWVNAMVVGPTSVWGCLELEGGRPGPLVELPADGADARLIALDGIDISAHLPPPPPRIDRRRTEEEVRERLTRVYFGGSVGRDPQTGAETRHPYIRGIEFEDVHLEGEFPATELVALFRSEQHPDVLFGRRDRIWHDDGSLSDAVHVMDVNLMEEIQACGYGLPSNPQPDAGVAWI
jgi:hypothetical protein